MANSSDFVVHCFFEQSGTFKNEFRKLGHLSYDYDILNDFGQTDYQIDLFDEIEKAFVGIPSLFNDIQEDDLIVAFFPCTRFSDQANLLIRCDNFNFIDLPDLDKLYKSLDYHHELSNFYSLLCKLCIVCLERNFRLIVENPYSQVHYLTRYFPIKPKVIDVDRRMRGDFFKKPTQFWFFNCEPKLCMLDEAYSIGGGKLVAACSNKVERSLITSAYAERFIKEFIL